MPIPSDQGIARTRIGRCDPAFIAIIPAVSEIADS
jgi:hypothetical protein